MQYKNFGNLDFNKIHPAGNLVLKRKTVEDLMITGAQIPFVQDNINMKKALEILTKKKLGFLIIQNKNRKTIGSITDGQIRRFNAKKNNFHSLQVKKVMTKNPISVDKDM